MTEISFPCPDCKGVKGHVHVSGDGFQEGLCTTCCGVGTKHMGRWIGVYYPRDPDQRKRMAVVYRKFMEREVT